MAHAVAMQIADSTIEIVEGDLTDLDTDAIVNPANANLQLGGGVAGAIARRGGPSIQAECDRHGPIRVGEAALTGAGELAARVVIHAVGPRMGEGDEDEKLASATRSALTLAERHGLESIALPAISTGIFGYPLDRCAQVMLGTIVAFIAPGAHLRRVVVCLWGEEAFTCFARELELHRAAES